ncbi:hypothetical protein S231_03970 [Candidatus Phytoplasma solani]|nr:hypothetical protein S231_03970 [Candidatus Phytoplasma solani]
MFFLIFPSVNHVVIKDKNVEGACIISDSTNGIAILLNKYLPFKKPLSLIIIFIILSWFCLLIASFFLKTKIIKKSFLATLILSLFLIFFCLVFSKNQQQVFNTFTVAKYNIKEFSEYQDYRLKDWFFNGDGGLFFQTAFFGVVFFGFSAYLLMVRNQIYLGINILIKALVTKLKKNHNKWLLFRLILGTDIIILLISFFTFKIINVDGYIVSYDSKDVFLSLNWYILGNCSVYYLIFKNALIIDIILYDKESKNTKFYKITWWFILFGIIVHAFSFLSFVYQKKLSTNTTNSVFIIIT